jgi:cytidylate kinase
LLLLKARIDKKGVETMTVITISREFGSQGEYVAERIAQGLGYHFVDKEFIGKVLNQYGVVEFDREYETITTFWEKFNAQREKRRDVMVAMLNQVVRAVAQHGNIVIMGRSGFAILAGFADVLHVRLQAPFPVRAARVAEQRKITPEEAETAVRENDKIRTAFIEGLYNVPWDSIHSFDLVIDTGKISADLAAGWVVEAAKAFMISPGIEQPTTSTIEVDPVLARSVSEALGCDQSH